MTYSVRSYQPEDYDSVLHIWKKTGMGGAHRGDDRRIIEGSLKNGAFLLVLVEDPTENIIGTSWITNDYRRLYLHHFGILPEYQGQGLSHPLMEKSLEVAKKKKMQIKLEVHKDSAPAIQLYKKYGFGYLGDYQVFIIREFQTQ